MRLPSLVRLARLGPARARSRRPPPRLRLAELEDRRVPAGFYSYLGGTESDFGRGAAIDAAGNMYVAAHTLSANIPHTVGSAHGGFDLYLAKLGPDGGLLWGTLIGGGADDLTDADPAVDAAGNVYLTGSTTSTDFPTTTGAFDETFNGTQANGFVLKVDGATGAVVYATYLSGAATTSGNAIAVDAAGSTYVTGTTRSTDFPTTAGTFQPDFGGGTSDAFVAKLDPNGSTLAYATYLGGGGGIESGRGIVVRADGTAYVAGPTESTNFPTTFGALDRDANGNGDAFVARLDATGSSLLFGTYLGGSGIDDAVDLDVDAAGGIYLTGSTYTSTFPVTPGAFQPDNGGLWDAYVAKLNPDGGSIAYATFLGGVSTDEPVALAVGAAGQVYVSGRAHSGNFPTTPDADYTTGLGGRDMFLTRLDAAGGAMVYSTYLGGGGHVGGMALDRFANAYLTGDTIDGNLPTTPGALQSLFAGGTYDGFVLKVHAGIPIGPAVTIDQAAAQADPTNDSTITFDVVFEFPVTGFEDGDVDLSTSTVGGSPSAAVSGSGSHYTVTVTGMSGSGTVVAKVGAGAADGPGGGPSLPSTSTDNEVAFDSVRPAVTVAQAAGQADPTNAAPVVFDVSFSEPVTGFDESDVSLAGSTVNGPLAAAVTQTGPTTYTVTVTGMNGRGVVVASIPSNVALDHVGNPNHSSTTTDNMVLFDDVAPTVQLNQGAGQNDPTSRTTITFDVTFSEPVVGFTAADVDLSASTAGGNLSPAIAPTGPSTYRVSVTGMTTRGDVIAAIPAGTVTDPAGNPNTQSTGVDNSVAFLHTGVLGFKSVFVEVAESAPGSPDNEVDVLVSRTGGSEGVVSVEFATTAGTAGLAATPDFVVADGTLTWGEGDADDKVIRVVIPNDADNEGREAFTIALSNATGGSTIGANTATVSIAPSDGVVIAGAAARPQKPSAVFIDDTGLNGDNVTVTLGGRLGTATVYLTDTDGDGRGPIELIELTGTDPLKSTLSIGVKKPRTGTGDGRVTVAELAGSGLKSLTASTTDLVGPGLRPTGWLGSIKIGNISGGADITLSAAPPATLRNPSVKIIAGIIGDGTDVTIGGPAAPVPLGRLTVTAFGDGTITAPAVGSITVKGRAKTRTSPAVAGDFGADLTVTGAGLDPLTGVALKSLKVAGVVSGSTITVDQGGVGAVTVGLFLDSLLTAGYTGPANGSGTFHHPSTVGSFVVKAKAGGFARSHVIAAAFKNVTLTSVDLGAGGGSFGFVYRDRLGRLTVGAPAFRFDPAGPAVQGLLGSAFQVKRA